MLKNLDRRLGPELLRALRAMGHGDEIAIVDGNYPAESHGRRVIPAYETGVVEMVDAILSVLPLDDFVPEAAFRPGIKGAPDRREPVFDEFDAVVARHEPTMKVHALHGDDFYARVRGAYAIVHTSEPRLYANMVLRKGVIRP